MSAIIPERTIFGNKYLETNPYLRGHDPLLQERVKNTSPDIFINALRSTEISSLLILANQRLYTEITNPPQPWYIVIPTLAFNVSTEHPIVNTNPITKYNTRGRFLYHKPGALVIQNFIPFITPTECQSTRGHIGVDTATWASQDVRDDLLSNYSMIWVTQENRYSIANGLFHFCYEMEGRKGLSDQTKAFLEDIGIKGGFLKYILSLSRDETNPRREIVELISSLRSDIPVYLDTNITFPTEEETLPVVAVIDPIEFYKKRNIFNINGYQHYPLIIGRWPPASLPFIFPIHPQDITKLYTRDGKHIPSRNILTEPIANLPPGISDCNLAYPSENQELSDTEVQDWTMAQFREGTMNFTFKPKTPLHHNTTHLNHRRLDLINLGFSQEFIDKFAGTGVF